jgi:hypothetical protein
MSDGAPVHFSRAVRDVLNNTYHDGWIDRGGPTAWPPRSPELNHLDFYVWIQLKPFTYAAPVANKETLRTVDACQTIRNYPGIFERIRCSVKGCLEARIEFHGGHFEGLLYVVFQL